MGDFTADTIGEALQTVRSQQPLVHNITNYVVMNVTANTLLAFGASPVMAHAIEEVEEFAAMAGALVLNIGTLSTPWIEAMFKAGHAARAHKKPIVLDPVGAGATRLRSDCALLLLREVKPSVVRGNASEILALGEGDLGGARGVDAQHSVEQARTVAIALARKYATVVAVTGAEDFVTDGQRAARLRNGHKWMAQITGSGCSATALIAALCAVMPDYFQATVAALTLYGIAGEMAADEASGPGSFQMRLLDALDALDAAQVRRCARFEIEA